MGASGSWSITPAWTARSPREEARSASRTWSWVASLASHSLTVPRYCLKYGVIVLSLFGLLQVWQAGGDGPLAPFRPFTPTAALDPLRVSDSHCVWAHTDPGARRVALEPALAILDEVHPAVAGWVRDAERQGKLQFTDHLNAGREGASQLAQYDFFRRTLTIGGGMFAENDGTIATILCHEYRHARQRLPKTIVYALSFVVLRHGDPAIVENDAQLFEREAQLAVFGKYQEL
jgi:hypothetical protein